MQWAVRWAPSLGALEDTHQNVWGTREYVYSEDKHSPSVFAGMYDLRDYLALLRHKGKAIVWWTGSDLLNLKSGFIFNDGKLKFLSQIFRGNWWVIPILKRAEHWVENTLEAEELAEFGIKAGISPSFLGDTKKYKVSFKPSKRPWVFLSCSGEKHRLYGWDVVERIADKCEVDFFLYGSSKWKTKHKNVFVRGRVDKETMNAEIKKMACALRPLEHDGFSETTAKNLWYGGYPITKIKYPMIDNYETEDELIELLNDLKNKHHPNYKARDYYLKVVNKYPWVSK